MMKDSELFFHVVTGNCYTSEAIFMVDIAVVREAYNQHNLNNISLVE